MSFLKNPQLDASGNGNDWTATNINWTSQSDTTYDMMLDVPTLTDEDTGNFVTLNPLSETSNLSTSEANLAVANSTTESTHRLIRGTIGMSTGKYYWEVNVNNSANVDMVGIINSSYTGTDATTVNASNGFGYGYNTSTGNWYTGTGWANDGTTPSGFPSSGIIGVAFDADNGKLYFSRNNTWINSANPSAGTGANATYSGSETEFLPAISIYSNTGTWRVNFGQRPFAYTPPTGYKKLNTYNLPDSAIKDGSKYMNPVLYTGDGTTDFSKSISLGFSPDFAWFKSRNSTENHGLYDTIRGGTNRLISNSTAAESTVNGIQFDSDGVNVYSSNTNLVNYVVWGWRGSDSTAVSNTDGTITSTVSANTTSGFSVVTYSGNGTGGATFGHGLGVAPDWVIIKKRTAVAGWAVYHRILGGTKYIALNTTDLVNTASGLWNNTDPSASLVTVGTDPWVNDSGHDYVAYVFAPVEGFSKFGTYTGNGSTNGPFVYTGFRPAFVMTKCSSTTGNWMITDIARNTYNVADLMIMANNSDTEYSQDDIDILSNGFKMKDTVSNRNLNGATFIYMAFAENPFKNSLAR